jgi:hypothetical protein
MLSGSSLGSCPTGSGATLALLIKPTRGDRGHQCSGHAETAAGAVDHVLTGGSSALAATVPYGRLAPLVCIDAARPRSSCGIHASQSVLGRLDVACEAVAKLLRSGRA